jgi:hypothetical protein
VTDQLPRRRNRLSSRNALWILLAVSLLFGLVIGLWRSRIGDEATQPVAMTIFIAVGVLVLCPAIIVLSIMHWRRLDEAAREAHKWAWYWGGSMGLIPGAAIALGEEFSVGLARRLGFVEPHELLNFGGLAILVCMLIGYLIAWAVWWLWRR